MAKMITVDPITRIEGHLRIDVEVDRGKVQNSWSSGQMWRGIENILQGRDPRDAWVFTQRFCGVCTTVHAIASVRAVENALHVIPYGCRERPPWRSGARQKGVRWRSTERHGGRSLQKICEKHGSRSMPALGQQLHCCPQSRYGSATAAPTGHGRVVYRVPPKVASSPSISTDSPPDPIPWRTNHPISRRVKRT